METGAQKHSQFSVLGETHTARTKDFEIEELAFLSLQIQREMNKRDPLYIFASYADANFNLLSEKLSFLESQTNQSWSVNKFYYWLNKYNELPKARRGNKVRRSQRDEEDIAEGVCAA